MKNKSAENLEQNVMAPILTAFLAEKILYFILFMFYSVGNDFK